MADDGDRDPIEPRGNQPAALESRAACISVDAGAGTGKTTTMILRIERAIERGDVDPEDVLVLTFANEAASNVREAIADRLGPDEAAEIDVHTYHSFCHRLVREYAYYLGRSPEFDVVTERARRRLVRRLLEENDYGFASTQGDGTAADLAADVDRFVATMSRTDVDPETLDDRLPDARTLELLGGLVLRLRRRADEQLSFDNEALRYFNRPEHLKSARESLVEYGKLLTYCREKVAEAPDEFHDDPVVRDVSSYFRTLQRCVTNVHEALSLEEPTTKHLPRALFCNEIRGGATGRIEQTPVGRLDHSLEFLRLARHYTDVYADYRAMLERDRTVDFDELVRTATRLLEDDRVADELTGRWEQVYCDEFQDTDPTQFSLVTRLTAGPDRPDLFAIGDTDQAIYGWRGTDHEGLERLARYDDHESVALELNFRSRQEILDLTNHCAYAGQSSKTLREFDRSPNVSDGDETPLRVGKVETDEVGFSTAEAVATTVSRLVNGELEGVPARSLSDLAVIVRTNRHAAAVAAELERAQIPYERSGSTHGELSPGIQTVLSYLRVLVDPEADVHLRRVLVYRYRLSESDLERLHVRDRSLYGVLVAADANDFDDPDRLERARTHLETLTSVYNGLPLSVFVRRFLEVTRLEWFLTGEERSTLERVERFADSYDANSVLTALTTEFVDALEHALAGSSTTDGRGTQSTGRVDVMTVHQAKGLQFDTVLVPYLSDEEWCVETDYVERVRYRLLAATIDDEVDSPLLADLAAETVAEEWRVLHVALTRAENHLLLFGSAYDYDGADGELSTSTAEACLASEIDWCVAGRRMDLWETLTDAFDRVQDDYPDAVADCTEEIARSASRTPGTITYYGGYEDRSLEPLETRAAIETVHRLGRQLRRRTLLPAADAADHADEGIHTPAGRSPSALSSDTVRFPVETLSAVTPLPVAVRHSYTAMRTHEECARKHYLDHAVGAVDDPITNGGDPGARIVGTIFHDVAEEAFYREYRTRAAWREAATRHLTARGHTAYREPVLDCVGRYFEACAPGIDAPVHEWEPLAAELPFVLDSLEGVDGEVVGSIDSIRRTPRGELVVLDYKTTANRIDPADATQLLLYVEAAARRFDEPISSAGYVYVGDAGPRVELLSREALPSWGSARETLLAVDDPSFEDVTPGDHCRYCPHRSLGCAPGPAAVEGATLDDD
ncbi:UvrD-helicase domain-containing protein [Natronobeatus ordinarius]|uniref:UvrD-helicase domain-containing protein n=1 Tax=Natronobeatus ordinarius TaxID=2963433 RepID=UPI0020CFE615|nr:UvrD-helicase domain-containing protein [Natronobeatus ordinarius]